MILIQVSVVLRDRIKEFVEKTMADKPSLVQVIKSQ